MRDDLDSDLLRLFEEKNVELPEDPFRAELRQRIEKARIGQGRIYWLFTALALAACAAATNFVIDGVTLFCLELSRVLQTAGAFLAAPAGLTVVSAVVLLSLLFNRYVLSLIE